MSQCLQAFSALIPSTRSFGNRYKFSVNATTIGDNGPNQGYRYVTSVSDVGPSPNNIVTAFYYVIAQDAKNSNSDFYKAQCGNHHPQNNPGGFISGAVLRDNIIHHESGTTANSHYYNYKTAQDNPTNNVGVTAEAQIGFPSVSQQTFLNNLANTLTGKGQAILDASIIEPCGMSNVSLDATCVFRGNINFAPYEPCP